MISPPRSYRTSGAFRQSLEERLNQIAANQNIDVTRLRRRIAFERLLARLFTDSSPRWILKGGYAIELRFPDLARATRDIDLSVTDSGLVQPGAGDTIRAWLQEEIEKDLGDWFAFLVGRQTSDLRAAPLGGARFPVEARLDHRVFARFNLDVGIGDALIAQPEWITGHELLSFAGIPAARVAVLPLDQQFAEKIHAYTVPRPRENTRDRDLIDLVLLIERGLPPPDQVLRALVATFQRRATHPLPPRLDPPPAAWRERYEAMAADYGLRFKTIEEAYEFLAAYWDKLTIGGS